MAGELTKLLGRTQMRVSDEEREMAVRSLRHHYAAGRITSAELEERVDSAYHATTRGDLDEVLYDLPSERGRRAAKRLHEANRGAWRAHFASYVTVNGGLVGIWGATGAGEFWPGWPMAWWGMFLGWHWLAARVVDGRLRRPRRSRRGRELRAGRSSRPLPR
jgi:uncharacterized protein DUF1707/2TM domain-containing protein